jgi:hypothetical protein
MAPFEFVMTLVSIIVALGVAELLVGIARILRSELKPYWIHAIWVFTLLVMQLQYSWSLFDLEARNEWVFIDLVRLLAPPITLFLASSLLFPSRTERIDLLTAVQFAGVAMATMLFATDRARVHAALTLAYAAATVFFVASFSYTLGDSAFR